MTRSPWASALRSAEDRLRARGLTGVQAFQALLPSLEAVAAGGSAGPGLADLFADLPPARAEDVLGLAYERFLPEVYKGRLGQYFTPPPLGALLWAHLPPVGPGDVVLDPTCGAGGLLVPAAASGARLVGMDIDPGLARLAAVQLRRLGVVAEISVGDAFRTPIAPADRVVANPPFSVPIRDPEIRRRHAAFAGPRGVPSDVVFLARLGDWVREGGWAAVVVPWSVVANPSQAVVREALAAAFSIERVVGLPEGVFRPFGGAAGRAAVLWLRRIAGAPLRPRWRAIGDPGWDVRSRHLRLRPGADIEAAVRGEGFTRLSGRWVPAAGGAGPPLSALARPATARGRRAHTLDLSQVDPISGDTRPTERAPARAGPVLHDGDLAFSRLRPELGVVALHRGPPVTGSGEWIVLRAPHPRWLRHALRTPSFVRALPTTGQTRPRAASADVWAAPVPAPPPEVRAAVHAASAALAARHRAAAEGLSRLQAAVDAHAAGDLDDEGLHRAALALGAAADYNGDRENP